MYNVLVDLLGPRAKSPRRVLEEDSSKHALNLNSLRVTFMECLVHYYISITSQDILEVGPIIRNA